MRYTTNLPSTIKGKITALQLAEREDTDDAVDWARYCLERTILTHLKRAERGSGASISGVRTADKASDGEF